jgi:hypothetical protein
VAFVLAITLGGCASVPAVPYEALADCPAPLVDKTTNGGLAKGVADLRLALKLCNNDKAILREWATGKDSP